MMSTAAASATSIGVRFVDFTPASPEEDPLTTLARNGVLPDELMTCEVFYDPVELDAAAARQAGAALVQGASLPVSAIPTSVGWLTGPGRRIQATVYVGEDPVVRDQRIAVAGPVVATGLLAVPFAGDVVDQTHAILDRIGAWLVEHDAGLDDVVKFNIFYVGGGDRENWAHAARVRARYFAEPGPATTGIPVERFEDESTQIAMQVVAIRDVRTERRHAWPADHWDWPFHLPYKHGCRVGDVALVGGQVPLDSAAQVIAANDFSAQVDRSLRYIERVLGELDVPRSAVERLTAFVASSPEDAQQRYETLRDQVDRHFPASPALVPVILPALAYPQMDVEIEAQARLPIER